MTDIEKRNKLVEDHLYMIDILIRKYLGKGVERDDLYQVGALALILIDCDLLAVHFNDVALLLWGKTYNY